MYSWEINEEIEMGAIFEKPCIYNKKIQVWVQQVTYHYRSPRWLAEQNSTHEKEHDECQVVDKYFQVFGIPFVRMNTRERHY